MTVPAVPTRPAAGTAGLAVTSSTGVMGLAVGRAVAAGGPDSVESVIDVEVATERRHAEELTPRLAELLDRAGLAASELGWLAVDVGPGRFTGLRVGLATVRGLAFAIGIPVVGVTSLEVLAAGASVGPATAVIDARRQEVFQQRFVDGVPDGEARVGRPEELAVEAAGAVLGDGFDRYRDLYLRPRTDPGGVDVVGLDGRHPRAADLLALAARRPAGPGTAIRPLYLREPDAVANVRTRPEVAAS